MNEELVKRLQDRDNHKIFGTRAKLIKEAATALARADERIAGLEQSLEYAYLDRNAAMDASKLIEDMMNGWKQRAEAAEAALKPFAQQADRYDPPEGDDDHPLWGAHQITIGEVRRARSVLKAEDILSTLKPEGEQISGEAVERGWQDISTAPKDGTWVLLYWPTMSITLYPAVGFHHGDEYGWEMVADREYGEVIPTHWMSCPITPEPKP